MRVDELDYEERVGFKIRGEVISSATANAVFCSGRADVSAKAMDELERLGYSDELNESFGVVFE